MCSFKLLSRFLLLEKGLLLDLIQVVVFDRILLLEDCICHLYLTSMRLMTGRLVVNLIRLCTISSYNEEISREILGGMIGLY